MQTMISFLINCITKINFLLKPAMISDNEHLLSSSGHTSDVSNSNKNTVPLCILEMYKKYMFEHIY